MKTVGLIGGVGPESTIEYYRFIIAAYREQKKDDSYPRIIINSIDLQQMLGFINADDWASATASLVEDLHKLVRAGADFAALSSNTPHAVFDELQRQCPVPLISIVESAAAAAHALGLKKLALFGSRFTMERRFYADVFARQGMTVFVPEKDEQAWIHEKYMSELIHGVILPQTRAGLLAIVGRMQQRHGIQALILGGTELPLILRDVPGQHIPFLDTTQIHVKEIVAQLLA